MSNAFARRSSALLSAAALATTGLVTAAAPAGAAITQGPEDAATGFPSYMVDDQGVAVQMCLDACIEVPEPGEPPAEPADPNHAPYFSAEAVAGPFTVAYEVATDAEVAGEPGALGNAAVIRADDVALGASYRIKGPWGTLRVRSDDRGRVQVERLNAVKSFLLPRNGGGELLGDGEVTTRVTGSPSGFNRVQITGPGVNASTGQFLLMGQKADDTAMTSVNTKALSMGRVTRSTPSTATIPVSSFGTASANVTLRTAGANPGAFTATGCASVASGSTCNIRVTYTPQANRDASAVLVVDDNGLAAPRRIVVDGTAHDTKAPKVESRTPGKGALAGSKSNVKVQFSEVVQGFKSGLALVDGSGEKVGAKVSRMGKTRTYVINPRQSLQGGRYTVKVNGGANGVHDPAGNAARDARWSFRAR